MREQLTNLLDREIALFTERQKRVLGCSATVGVAALYLYVIARSLLSPASGRGILDDSLFPPTASLLLNVVILLELIAGTVILLICFRKSRFLTLGALCLIFSSVVAVRSAFSPGSWRYCITANILLGYAFLMMSLWLVHKVKPYRRVFPAVLLAVFTAYGVRCLWDWATHPKAGYRLQAFFHHANHLGNVLAFALIFSFALAVCAKRPLYRILSWALVVSLTVALVHTLSRGAWLACIVGLAACLIYLRRCISIRTLGLNLALLVTVAGIALISASPSHVAKRFSSDSPDMRFSAGNRLLLWRTTGTIIRDHWLTGVGIGAFGETLRRDYKDTRFANGGTFNGAMNNYLTLAAEAGVPASLLYLACIFYACFLASKSIKGNGLETGIRIGLLCGVYSMLVFGFTTGTVARVYAVVLMWSALGYLVSQSQAPSVQDGQQASRPSKACSEGPST